MVMKVQKLVFLLEQDLNNLKMLFSLKNFPNYYEDLTTNSKASKNLKKQSGSYTESKFFYGLDYDMKIKNFKHLMGLEVIFRQGVSIIF